MKPEEVDKLLKDLDKYENANRSAKSKNQSLQSILDNTNRKLKHEQDCFDSEYNELECKLKAALHQNAKLRKKIRELTEELKK